MEQEPAYQGPQDLSTNVPGIRIRLKNIDGIISDGHLLGNCTLWVVFRGLDKGGGNYHFMIRPQNESEIIQAVLLGAGRQENVPCGPDL